MKLKHTIDDLDLWYQEHMRTRSHGSPRTGRNTANYRQISAVRHDRPLLSSQSAGQLGRPTAVPSLLRISARRTNSTGSSSFVEVEDEGECSSFGGSGGNLVAAAAAVPSVDSGGRASVLGSFLHRLNRPAMKKSDAGKIPPLKNFKKGQSKSPCLPKKQPSPDTLSPAVRVHYGSGTLHPPPLDDVLRHSTEDLEMLDTSSKENGGSIDTMLDDVDEVDAHPLPETSESSRVKAAIDHLHQKIDKTKEMIKTEQAHKEANVNEYLRLASSTEDKQQAQRIKTVFEKRNQKSAQGINQLQKKLENYQRKLSDIERRGLAGHKQAKDRLRDVGQGLKDVGANIVDGITGFSGGVVDNIKGAKDTIVAKPKEFAHLIKNKFGSADNINQLKMDEEKEEGETRQPTGGTLPASFKYGSDDEGSSITSGSGFGAHSSPHSTSQNTSQQLPVLTQAIVDPILLELEEMKDFNRKLTDQLQKLAEEYDTYKATSTCEISILRGLLDEEKYKVDRQEDQINDLTELHQNEITNLKQDITSMEEKIEYRLDERTTDLSDLVDNCQTRIQRLEQQQQQQQILSMEMVENVTFRTILTKLINVVLALLAVVLVFVSTAANLLSPFLTSRMRILWTIVLAVVFTVLYHSWDGIEAAAHYSWDMMTSIWPWR
ncbi:transmembrane and coiled-coil domain protein 3-like isoform X2 [Haliotis asinina]|uniref:transmembrane and coiled-coil domain protein 3-like isoform X1 n=2 Tax=Haliotis asinina TaxID=109174 RepID=UPI003531EE44